MSVQLAGRLFRRGWHRGPASAVAPLGVEAARSRARHTSARHARACEIYPWNLLGSVARRRRYVAGLGGAVISVAGLIARPTDAAADVEGVIRPNPRSSGYIRLRPVESVPSRRPKSALTVPRPFWWRHASVSTVVIGGRGRGPRNAPARGRECVSPFAARAGWLDHPMPRTTRLNENCC